MNSLILCLQLMPAVYNVEKASFDSKLDRLFHFVKLTKSNEVFIFQHNLTKCFYYINRKMQSISAIAKAKDVVHHKQPFLIVVGLYCYSPWQRLLKGIQCPLCLFFCVSIRIPETFRQIFSFF